MRLLEEHTALPLSPKLHMLSCHGNETLVAPSRTPARWHPAWPGCASPPVVLHREQVWVTLGRVSFPVPCLLPALADTASCPMSIPH